MVTAWSGSDILKNIDKVSKKSYKGIQINFMYPVFPKRIISNVLKALSYPSGGAADQSRGPWDQAAGGGPWDTRKPAEPAPHSHRGDGGFGDRALFLVFSPSVPLSFPVSGDVLPRQEARERLGVQAASRAQRTGAEAH